MRRGATHIEQRERPISPNIGADGATTPETLRQMDRCKIIQTLKSGLIARADGVSSPKHGERISQANDRGGAKSPRKRARSTYGWKSPFPIDSRLR
ncbi:hypothetical protein AGR3A_Cc260011 [Agrobacterium tomkonis CFBP 6623]|uniref:Uncharacterized protein n=1 Tax=Agrobacterium tomkonis CFBP 6623 TaxID=1183432 RepID=A0A1S7PGX3_9HYPH|nr:hypothetical protein AGR3A_Cc260011 [Agrobacterium tomkonis CFBP 6623]